MTMSDHIGVVFDVGSMNMKSGFSGEPYPRYVIPSVTARFCHQGLIDGVPSVYHGLEAIKHRGISDMTWPVKAGVIEDWDEMEKLWYQVFFKNLHVPPETSNIIHALHPLAAQADKERMAEIFFESFAVNSLHLATSPSLVLYASGRTTGLVWENGDACSYVAPVYEGFPLKYSIVTAPIAGRFVTKALQKMLSNTGYSFTTPAELDQLERIKKEVCYVSRDYEVELKKSVCATKLKYTLPDGQTILLGDEKFKCAEILFKPELADMKCGNILDVISNSTRLCDISDRKMFYNNIVVSGGSSMLAGLTQRLADELTKSCATSVHIDSMDMRQYAAWIGASLLSSLSNMKDFWLTKEQYDDSGAQRVRYKFF